MTKIEELLTEATQALAELVGVAEKNAQGMQAAALEQALAELNSSLRKTMQADAGAIVAAIKGLTLTVNVNPTPLEIIVPPASRQPFVPFEMEVIDFTPLGGIKRVRITEAP